MRVLSLVNGSSINGFNSQEMSNICWAIGTAGIEARFPNAFDTTITSSKGLSSNQDTGNDLVTSFFGFAAVDVMRRPEVYDSQAIANLLWGFSTVRVDDLQSDWKCTVVSIFFVDFDCDVYLTLCLVHPCFGRPASGIPICFDRSQSIWLGRLIVMVPMTRNRSAMHCLDSLIRMCPIFCGAMRSNPSWLRVSQAHLDPYQSFGTLVNSC